MSKSVKPVNSLLSGKGTKPTAKPTAIRLIENDKKIDTINYIFNPQTEKHVLKSSPLGKKLVGARESGSELPRTITETERLILVVKAFQDALNFDDSKIQKILEPIVDELPRTFPAYWGGKQKEQRHPEHPKQSSSQYTFFFKEVYEQTRKENPNAKATEIMAIVGKKWDKVTDRKKYEKLAAADKLRYETQMKAFEEKYPEHARTKSSPKSDKPTKATAYSMFCETNRQMVKDELPDLSGKEVSKLLAEKWAELKTLPDEHSKFQILADEINIGFEERVSKFHDSPKGLSKIEQAKADDPEHYELNPETGRYVRKVLPKAEKKSQKIKRAAAVAATKKISEIVAEELVVE